MSVTAASLRLYGMVSVILLASAIRTSHACSTFLLRKGPTTVVGHNLDQDFYTPGSILVSPRGQTRHSRCADDLGLTTVGTPPLAWTSRFGSVTFTILGLGFPDGGINEAGLVVSEMALGKSSFSHSPQRPTMFIHQWIQYQLDSYSTIAEVLEHLSDINVDPSATFSPVSLANYHFFLADAQGEAAVLEFLDGHPVVHSGSSLGVPALCNRPYADEMQRYTSFSGIVGSLYRWLDAKGDQRFLVCADGLTDFDPALHPNAVDYAFDLLTRMQFEATRQWSVVYDIAGRSVAFRTVGSPGIKTLDINSLEFSKGATVRILRDIDSIASGDVADALQPFDEDANRESIARFLTSLVSFVAGSDAAPSMDAYLNVHHGLTLQEFIGRAHRTSIATTEADYSEITGNSE
jgi:hypothetical protein